MAYSGSGTQNDPYVVSTYSDLKYVTDTYSNSGTLVYVKVGSDINCADDPNYTGIDTTYLKLSYIKLYADTLATIEGLSINSTCFLELAGAYTFIENIYFKNCVFKSSSSSGAVFNNIGSATASISSCKFSMVCNFGGSSGGIFKAINASNCSGYFKCVNSNSSVQFGQSVSPFNVFNMCNFIVDSLKIAPLTAAGNYAFWNAYGVAQGYITNTSIIFKNCTIDNPASLTQLDIFYVGNQSVTNINASYIAFLNCDFSSSYTTLCAMNGNCSGALSIVATDNTSLTLTSSDSTVIEATTISNLRDKNYLLSIGFIP